MSISPEQIAERDKLEPSEKICLNCGTLKPSKDYRPLPSGGRRKVCRKCNSQVLYEGEKKKADRTTASDETIQSELWSQYDRARNTSEKIRCLEALVKLRPQNKQSDLESPAVVAELMKRLKKKKQNGE